MELLSAENLLALVTLTAMEVVLGIDNIVFIAILTGRLPKEQQASARRAGLLGAMLMRIILLLFAGYLASLKTPVIEAAVAGWSISLSVRDIVLLVGGLVLLAKATMEIHHTVEGEEGDEARAGHRAAGFAATIGQVMVMDLVFSIDSVITAVGMANSLVIMVTAVIVSVAIMMAFARPVSDFVHRHPSLKVLGLAFLVLIGVMLVAEGLGQHVPKGYIYFAMAFSLGVETLNIRARTKRPAAG